MSLFSTDLRLNPGSGQSAKSDAQDGRRRRRLYECEDEGLSHNTSPISEAAGGQAPEPEPPETPAKALKCCVVA